jgi:TolB protein
MVNRHKGRLWLCAAFILAIALSGCRRADAPPSMALPISTSTPALLSPLPDGGAHLTFMADGDLYVLQPGDTIPNALIASPAYESMPAWSPDGTYLAYIATDDDKEEIIIALVDGQSIVWQVNVTHNSAREHAPAWSPDGRHMAFVSNRDTDWGLYVGEVLKANVQQDAVLFLPSRVTFSRFYDGHPAWSPDDERIAFTSDRGLRWQIFLTKPSGADQMPFPGTDQLRSTAYPSWSPDGTRLAFASTTDGNWEIYTIGIDGSDLHRLTDHPARDWDPTWSPDGAWIAFVSDRSGNGDIYLVRPDGSKECRLTDSDAVEMFPAWRSQISSTVL